MRTRHRDTILTSIAAGSQSLIGENSMAHFGCNGLKTSEPGGTLVWPSFVTGIVNERITDVPNGKGSNNPVVHRKMIRINDVAKRAPIFPKFDVPVGYTEYIGFAGSQYWPYVKHILLNEVLPGWDVNLDTGMPTRWSLDSSSVSEDSLKNAVLDAAKQQKADVLLNLVEANQAWPSVKSLSTSLPFLAAKWKKIRKILPSWIRMRQQLGKAASGYLAWKFGISPLISDTENVISSLGSLEKAIRRHKEGSHSRFSIVAEVGTSFNQTPIIRNQISGVVYDQTWCSGRAIAPPTIRYVLVTKPNVQYYSDLFNRFHTLFGRYSSSPASLAWEKVPFSFVVDWFVDLRGVLNLLDKMVGFSPYHVVSFSRSFSYHLETAVSHEYRKYCPDAPLLDRHSCGVAEYKHYERKPVSGLTNVVWKPRFGKNQAGISAALIVQSLTAIGR